MLKSSVPLTITTVLLALGPRLFYESLIRELQSHSDIDAFVSESADGPDLLMEVHLSRADCVIMSTEKTADIPGIYSHLFSEFPELVVIVLSENDGRATVYRQEVVAEEIRSISVECVLTTLRGTNKYWSPS